MVVGLTRKFLFHLFLRQAWAQCAPYKPEVLGVVGGVVCLSPSPELQGISYSRIHWRRNESEKLASWARGEGAQYPNTPYKDRLELLENHALKIRDLRKSDSSEYQLYLEDDTGREDKAKVTLRVYEQVPKPMVTVTVAKGDQQQCNATLKCSVGLEEVTYEWIPAKQILQEGRGDPVQEVSFNPSERTYVCRVSNPVSSNNASLTYRHPCSWTGEPSTAASSPGTTGLLLLGHLLLLLSLLALA